VQGARFIAHKINIVKIKIRAPCTLYRAPKSYKIMFYHLKIILRNLRSNGLYSIINIAGLAVSLTACILILLWVQDEWSFDKFHKRSRDIFKTIYHIKGFDEYWPSACAPLAFTAKEEIPEIENACRFYPRWDAQKFKYVRGTEENIVKEFTCSLVDTTFFSMFNFKILEGDRWRMLVEPQSIVLTASIAKQLFGDETPIGKTISDDKQRDYYVTGVIADMPENSSIRFDILLPVSLYKDPRPGDPTASWRSFGFQTWFRLRPHADVAAVEKKLDEIQLRNNPNDPRGGQDKYQLKCIESLNFHNDDGSLNEKAQTSRLFSIVALVVILIACVNYVNISTARASRRNKELFVKNILGARKWKLFFQFLSESALLFLISLVVATFLLYLIFPTFNLIAGKQLEFHLLSVQTWIVYGLTFLIVILFAGIYPALSLAVQKPLQGINNKSGNAALRRILVVGQFMIAIVLIMVTITSTLQLEYVKRKNLGYTKENIFYVPVSKNLVEHVDAVKSELLQNPAILGVTATSQPLKNITIQNGIFKIEGIDGYRNGHEELLTVTLYTDTNFFSTMNIELLEGRNFTGTLADAGYVILNETAIKTIGLKEPIGKKCSVAGNAATIIGVVRDFHFKNLHTPIEPFMIRGYSGYNYLYVKTSAAGAPEAIAAVEKFWKQYETEIPFSYQFVDDEFDTIYKTDIRAGILFRYFAGIAIFISCLGLFGLVAFTAETKTKEIGIRKVLGARVSNIVNMLSKEFLILVGIAMLFAFPLAYYWIDKMLQDYAYHIRIGWWMFALAGLITIVLTLITVGWQAVKAATANPVKAIKSE